uniref:Inhibitor I9 domain-containing protein n=1 Tax=Leersia perrieri TaxID=77586 RepID=A0A0D9V593_9ORYZ
MEIAPFILLSFLLLLHSTAAAPSPATAPVADEHASSDLAPSADQHGPDVYIVFISRDDYVDSVDYDVRLLASVLGSAAEAKTAMIYHYSGVGFAANLVPEQAERLSRKEGIAVFKDRMYHVEKEEDGRLPRFFEDNV